jgi:hypothetical protein
VQHLRKPIDPSALVAAIANLCSPHMRGDAASGHLQ